MACVERLLHDPAAAGGEDRAHGGGEAGGPEDRAGRSRGGCPRCGRTGRPASGTAGSGARWPWTMPFGSLVVPDVKITTPRSSGVDGRARSSRALSATASPAARKASHDGVPSVATRRRDGRSGCSAVELVAEAPGEQAVLGEDGDGVGPAQHAGEVVGGGERRHGDGDRARHRRAEDRRHRLRPVAHDDRDGVARLDARGEQGAADAAGLGAEAVVGPADGLAVAQRVVQHQRLAWAVPGDDVVEERAERRRSVGQVAERRTLEGRHRAPIVEVGRVQEDLRVELEVMLHGNRPAGPRERS